MGCLHSTARLTHSPRGHDDFISPAFRQTCRCRIEADRVLNHLNQLLGPLNGAYRILQQHVHSVQAELEEVLEASPDQLAEYNQRLQSVEQDLNAIVYGAYDPDRFFDQSPPQQSISLRPPGPR